MPTSRVFVYSRHWKAPFQCKSFRTCSLHVLHISLVKCIRNQINTWYPINSGCIWALQTPLYHRVHKHHTGWDRLAVCHDCRECLYHFISEHYSRRSKKVTTGVRWSLKIWVFWQLLVAFVSKWQQHKHYCIIQVQAVNERSYVWSRIWIRDSWVYS